MKELLNGTPLPNWVKLVVLGATVGILIGVNQAAVGRLEQRQQETTAAVTELRVDMRDRLVTRQEFNILQQRVESNARRLDNLEASAVK